MKTLNLTLKKKWFDMIASGEKKEEYREIKPYWINRLFYYNQPVFKKHDNHLRKYMPTLDSGTIGKCQTCIHYKVSGIFSPGPMYCGFGKGDGRYVLNGTENICRDHSQGCEKPHNNYQFYSKEFDLVSANNGYAKDCPNIKWKHEGIRIGEGRPEWGADPGKQYFVLSIGELVKS